MYGRAVDPPATRYLDRRGKQLAYQSFGDGASAVVLFQEVISHLDLQWTDPTWVQQCRRLAAYARVVVFQQVGVGLSDTIDRVPTLEEQASDIGAVMDAEKIGSATLSGVYSTAMPILLFAAQSRAAHRTGGQPPRLRMAPAPRRGSVIIAGPSNVGAAPHRSQVSPISRIGSQDAVRAGVAASLKAFRYAVGVIEASRARCSRRLAAVPRPHRQAISSIGRSVASRRRWASSRR